MVNLSLTHKQYRTLRITLVDAIELYRSAATRLKAAGLPDLAKDYESREREVRNLYFHLVKTSKEYSIVEAESNDRQMYIPF